MRTAILLLPAILLAGCPSGEDRSGAVTGSVELASPRAGPPDAGTSAGHGADSAAGETARTWFVLRGSVRPAGAEVRVLDARYMGLGAVPERRGPAFRVRLGPLRPGANRFVVEATAPGLRAWRLPVRIVRRAPAASLPRTVRVPAADDTPPEAKLQLNGRVVTALGRDAGGLVRIRVSAELRIACGSGSDRELVLHVPPAMVERPHASPGVRLPTRLHRTVDLAAAAARRCGGPARRVSGRAWAEATDAHGRDGYSAYVPLR